MLLALPLIVKAVEYSLAATDLTISGEGQITQIGIRSKGAYQKFTKIIINNGISSIDSLAFEGCHSLKYIRIPQSVTFIGPRPFRDCKSLVTFDVDPLNNKYCTDDQGIFYTHGKKALIRVPVSTNFVVPEGVELIARDAFSCAKKNLGNITFPSTVTTLELNTFDSGKFDTITFNGPSQLKEFEGFVWAEAKTIKIPNSVTTIKKESFKFSYVGKLIFEENSQLTTLEDSSIYALNTQEIILPDSLTTIKEFAFQESSVKKIRIGPNCNSIAITAFTGCSNLTEIEIDSNNKNYKFTSDGSLINSIATQILFIKPSQTSVTIDSTISSIGKTVLQNTKDLTSLVIDNHPLWSTNGGALYSSNFNDLIAVCGGVTDLNVHKDVQTIKDFAAYGCKSLKTVTFAGNSVTLIDNNAFSTSSIVSFDFPSSVQTIAQSAFYQTNKLETFTIKKDSGLVTVKNFAFQDSTIKSFYFGRNVNVIEFGAFYWCESLTSITFDQQMSLYELSSYAFEGTHITSLEVPSSVTNVNLRCFNQCHFVETLIFKEDSQLTSIGSIAFQNCYKLWKVILPSGCSGIENGAFNNCKALTVFKHSVTTIGGSAFSNCLELENFNFSVTQETIDSGVFFNCIKLVTFNVAEGNQFLKGIGGSVYNPDATKLYLFPPGQEIAYIPTKTVEFADNAFYQSPNLKYVAFFSGSKLQTIGKAAFYECKKLIDVQFPNDLQDIKSNSFTGCSSLKAITFPTTLSTIESGAFKGCNLKTVKYCGSRQINGTNVFEKNVEILVTDIYQGETFCSNKIARKLTFNCELKEQYIPTCEQSKLHLSMAYFITTIFLCIL